MFEHYKLYVADLVNIGARYSTTNTFYMSILSALTGLLAYTDANRPLHALGSTAALLPAFAAIACLVWCRAVTAYRHIFAAKFEVLRIIERNLDIKPYTLESEALRGTSPITAVDQAVPLVLFAAYAAIVWVLVSRT